MEEESQFSQLRVSLGEEKFVHEDVNTDATKDLFGGVGYAADLLYRELAEGIDLLSSDNKIVLATGPLTHPLIPGGGSLEICFKSPLTGGWGESRVGSDFGFQLKRAGYDYVIIEGVADEPSILFISDGEVDLVSAREIKGKLVSRKTEWAKDQLLGGDGEVLSIGPAGENLVPFSTAIVEDRSAGRTGIGALMGSKNLFAVAVQGTGEIPVVDKGTLVGRVREVNEKIRNNPDTGAFREHGTTGDIPECDETGDWPTKNWLSNSWGNGEEIYQHFYEKNLVGNEACYTGCPIACGRRVEVKEGKFKTPEHGGGEYESISAFTAFILNENVDAAVHSTYLCNEYGLDTISTGANIAFLMDCYDRGLVDKDELNGLDLSWGNAEVLPELVKSIALREGPGKLVTSGVEKAAEIIGGGSEKLAIHGKGLEAPAHDPRSGKTLALTYGTANRGMCHIHPVEAMVFDSGKMDFGLCKYGLPDPEKVPRWSEEGKGEIVKILQDGGIVPDLVGTCKFFMYVGVELDDYAKMLEPVTGWEVSGEDLLEGGERASNLQRAFNIREGFSAVDDEIPERMKSLPEFGNYANEPRCEIEDYQSMLIDYYKARGWNSTTGEPTDEKLKELGLKI